jgi:glycosyltransferase involved in cell wall biosynthesis
VRILHLTHAAVPGGGEIAVARLLGELRHSGIDSIAGCSGGGPLADGWRAAGLDVRIVPLPRTLADRRRSQLHGTGTLVALPATLLYAVRIARTARAEGVDLIHTCSMKAHVGGLLAGWLAQIPVVVSLQDDLGSLGTGSGTLRLLTSLIRRRAGAVTGCAAHVLRHPDLAGVPAAVMYPGVPSELLAATPHPEPDPPVVGMVARISPSKGQSLFLDAAEAVARTHPSVRFRIVGAPLFGEDDELERFRARAAAGPLAGRVEFAGFSAHPVVECDRLTVAVACSLLPEAFGQVVVEAMARGRAVVAPAEGGPLEIVTPGEDGLLVPPRDAGALADAIRALLDDEAWRALLGARAIETVKRRFTESASADTFIAVVARLTDGSGR